MKREETTGWLGHRVKRVKTSVGGGTQRAFPSLLLSFPSSHPCAGDFCPFTHGSKQKDLSATRKIKRNDFTKERWMTVFRKIGFLCRTASSIFTRNVPFSQSTDKYLLLWKWFFFQSFLNRNIFRRNFFWKVEGWCWDSRVYGTFILYYFTCN